MGTDISTENISKRHRYNGDSVMFTQCEERMWEMTDYEKKITTETEIENAN